MFRCYAEVQGRNQADEGLETYHLELNLCYVIILVPCARYFLRTVLFLEYLSEELGNGRSYQSHYAGSSIFQEVVEILTCHRSDRADIRVHLRVVARECLAVAYRASSVGAEVLHQVSSLHFLLFVLCYHQHPACHYFLVVVHLVNKLLLIV